MANNRATSVTPHDHDGNLHDFGRDGEMFS